MWGSLVIGHLSLVICHWSSVIGHLPSFFGAANAGSEVRFPVTKSRDRRPRAAANDD
jgi:hypothetical protein